MNQNPCARSSFSTADTVLVSFRSIASREMTPSPPAAAVAHSPQPMFVGEVCTDGTGLPGPLTSILSAARPNSVVIASIERYVEWNHLRSSGVSEV